MLRGAGYDHRKNQFITCNNGGNCCGREMDEKEEDNIFYYDITFHFVGIRTGYNSSFDARIFQGKYACGELRIVLRSHQWKQVHHTSSTVHTFRQMV